MLQKCLLNAGMIANTGWLAVMPPLPEADLALVNAKCCTKGALGQASQHTRGAELTSGDQIVAVYGHRTFRCSVTRHIPPPRWRSRSE